MNTTGLVKVALIAATLAGATRVVRAEPPAPPEEVRTEVKNGKPGIDSLPGETKEEEDPSAHFNFTDFSYSGQKDAEGEPKSPPFLLLVGNFAVLLLVLAKYGSPAVKKLAEDRHYQIKHALDEAKALRDQAKQKLAEYEGRIKSLDADIQKLVDGIRTDAEADKVRILAAAEVQAAQMKRDAELRIAAEVELARTQLTREVTAAAAAATEQLLRDKTTADDQRQLVQTFLTGIARPEARR